MPQKIVWGGKDPFMHMLVVGAPRKGKTATILEPIIYQLLIQKKKGKSLGLSVIEPKSDLIFNVKEFCDVMKVPYVYINPDDPEHTHRFNVMEGDTDDVAEATVAVLQSLFGKQEAFFKNVQESSSRNVTKLLKELHGDDLDLIDVLATLRDPRLLKQKVEELKRKKGQTELVEFFENELLGTEGEKYRQFVIGLRTQLENITANEKLKKVITGKSDINLDEHFKKGGVLLVNTALGTLKKSGDAFGMFVAMHLQSATFRRKGTENTRIPHYLIIDEYGRYINPDIEIFLSMASSYKVAGIFAIQSLGQLEVESGKISAKAMKQTIFTNCQNKIAFGGLSAQDAKEFAEEFGKDQIIMRQSTYRNRILLPRFFPDTYRDTETEQYRYHPTYLQDEMQRLHYICRIMNDGVPQRPIEGIGQFVPRNWKELREWETGNTTKKYFTKEIIINKFQLFKQLLPSNKKENKSANEISKQISMQQSDPERVEQDVPNQETQKVVNCTNHHTKTKPISKNSVSEPVNHESLTNKNDDPEPITKKQNDEFWV